MSGMGKPDEEAENAMAIVDNGIELARLMLRTGPSRPFCLDCGDPIPEARRKAVSGCLYCIGCQSDHDKKPNVRVVTKML